MLSKLANVVQLTASFTRSPPTPKLTTHPEFTVPHITEAFWKKYWYRLPGSPVVKTLGFHSRGRGFRKDPICHRVQPKTEVQKYRQVARQVFPSFREIGFNFLPPETICWKNIVFGHIYIWALPFLCSVTKSYLTVCNPMDCSTPVSSVHDIFQAIILEWVAMPSSGGYSQPRDQTHVLYLLCLLHWQVNYLPLGQYATWDNITKNIILATYISGHHHLLNV